MIYILKLSMELILFLHVIGCIWFAVVEWDGSNWTPPIDFVYISRPDYMRFYDLEEVTSWYQYWVSVYYATAALGGNEMGARTNVQLWFWFAFLILLVLFNGYIFGQMTIRVGEATK